MIKNGYRGFTIVELLIVIVIIAILASVTVTAFNGVQQRAKTTATASQSGKMHKYLRAYIALNSAGQFKTLVPESTSTSTMFCLGTGYEDVVEGGAVGCYTNPVGQHSPSNSNLDSIIQSIGNPSTSGPTVTIDPNPGMDPPLKQSAPRLMYNTSTTSLVDGRPSVWGAVSYILQGDNVDCGNRPMLVYTGTSGGNLNYTATNGAKNSSYGSGYTECNLYFHPDI